MTALSFALPGADLWDLPVSASSRVAGDQPGLLAQGPDEKQGLSGRVPGFKIVQDI
jgi:hypothetical protein